MVVGGTSALTGTTFFGWVLLVRRLRPAGLQRFVLDARFSSVQVQATILDVLIDLLGCLQEGILHIIAATLRVRKDALFSLISC